MDYLNKNPDKKQAKQIVAELPKSIYDLDWIDQFAQELTVNQPVAPLDYTKELTCPILGLFGNEDKGPSPEQVNQLEEELKKYGKNYKFYRYDGAGHGFWYYQGDMYRPKQAMDSWQKVFAFFGKYLQS